MKLMGVARAAMPGLAVTVLALSGPAAAEVVRATDNSFVSRHEVVVEATPKEVWLALIAPATWWDSAHTWSGDAKNLTLTPQAGGCFCETIPEVDEPGRFTLEGSVEHMRVVQAYPEAALRMVGNLGPLQSEPVAGVLTIAISTVDKGTRIVWEYNVGGPMRYEVPVISKAVDGVMGTQLAALAKPLGIVPPSASDPAPAPVPELPPAEKPDPAGPGGTKGASASLPAAASPKPAAPGAAPKPAAPAASPTSAAPVVSAPVPAPKTAPKPAPKPAPAPSSVADAFSDIEDKPKPKG